MVLLTHPITLFAAFPARQAMKRTGRQILTALPPPGGTLLSLSSTVYWRTAHGCGQRAYCRRFACVLVSVCMCALPTVGDPTGHVVRPAGTMWPVCACMHVCVCVCVVGKERGAKGSSTVTVLRVHTRPVWWGPRAYISTLLQGASLRVRVS